MKNEHILRAAIAAFILPLLAINANAEVPAKAKEILERNIEALGGRERIEKVESVKMDATMSLPAMGITASMQIILAHPDKGYVKQVMPGMGEMVQAFDGESGWAMDPMQGFRNLEGDELKALIDQQDGIRDVLDYETRYSSIEVLPDETVDGKPTDTLRMVSALTGRDETRYFDKETGFELQTKTVADGGPMGSMPLTVKFSQFEEHDGLFFPKQITVVNPAMTVSVTFNKIEVNAEIDPSIFLPPQ